MKDAHSKYMHQPCANCPFRKDVQPGWLGRERMAEICESPGLVCHKTTDASDADLKQCAGHMLLLGEQSGFVQVARLFNFSLELRGRELVFDTIGDAVNHHDWNHDDA